MKKTRNTVFAIALFVFSAFSAPNVNLVSPYVVRGYSKTYAISHHPETFTGYYEIKSINAHKDETDTLKSFIFMETERFNTVGIKDKIEIGLSLFGLPVESIFVRARFRVVYNLYNNGGNNLFESIAISPIVGTSGNIIIYEITQQNHEHYFINHYISTYCGVSIGTRKFVQEKYSFELFSSPSYSITVYQPTFVVDYNNISNLEILQQSLDIPVGFRYISEKRIVKFSIKSGIGLHFIVNDKRVNDGGYALHATINSSYSFNSSYLSAFAEMGLHFGARRYNRERREQLNFEEGLSL